MNIKVGVIVARFQTPFLHDGHLSLIKHVLSENSELFIILGSQQEKDEKNPFTFSHRSETVRYQTQKYIERIFITEIHDIPGDDRRWSFQLDNLIESHTGSDKVTLYGSRDSFIIKYTGRFQTKLFYPEVNISSTEIRNKYLKIL